MAIIQAESVCLFSPLDMKQLLDKKKLPELLALAQVTEQKAKELCDLTTEVDEKWHTRLKSDTKHSSTQ